MTLDPPRLVADIARRLVDRSERNKIVADWYKVDGSRNADASQVRDTVKDRCVVPLVVSHGFQKANELMADRHQFIHGNESELSGVSEPCEETPLVLLLLSHDELRIPQISSPTVHPVWFPGLGGCEVLVWIEDLTWKAEVPVNSLLKNVVA